MCCGERFVKPKIDLRDGTTLVEMEINNISDAHYVAGLQPFGFTPIVLLPRRSSACCPGGWYQEIPEGFNAIVISMGKDLGIFEPGFHIMPPWRRVSHLVTKQLVVFDTPVKDCKTADNVTVNLDVMILFEIIDGRKFVFNLGPEKLDGLMRAAQEDSLRKMASSVTADTVLELQGRSTTNIVDELNVRFNEDYGVHIHHMTVKVVRLPKDLMDTWQKKTIYTSQEILLQRQQELKVMEMNNANALRKMDEELQVETQQAEEQYVTTRAQMSKEIAGINSATNKLVAGIQAEQIAEREKLKSSSDVNIARLHVERDQVSRDVQLESEAEKREIMTDAHKYQKERIAETTLSVATNQAAGLTAIAEAEGYAAEGFRAKREYEVAKEQLLIYEKLSHNNAIKVASSTENLMGLAPRNDAVTQVVQRAITAANAKLMQLANEATPTQSRLVGGLFA